ncbi:copper homeostasis protein CutC [Salinibacterium sp. M195]|uniref:copper homeostasis protein CutC n=1 Tax=Salinibacterium sp. M195 TaxID=2583374 RepID=UPI001C631EB3|nr:copper homeostasis protein CutC [Salinibacterium sp. M195]QYH35077.1 copper homeostasis protein CutC [Salinibacterium sp. M195]
MTILEVCLDDIGGALDAEQAGAQRIELCAALDTGGITPSLGTVSSVLASLTSMTVMVLIRQRGGDFVYSPAEVDAMVADIRSMRDLPRGEGVTLGFVIGALTPQGTVDSAATAALVDAADVHPVTFHKAFDLVVDHAAALETLIALGIPRVLTSGGASSVLEGADVMAALVAQAGERLTILAGGGVRAHNAQEILNRTGVTELHFRAPVEIASNGYQGGASALYDSGSRTVTSPELVRAMHAAVAPL